MYPLRRLGYHLLRARKQPALGLLESDEITIMIWPWDLDVMMELNNGRAMSLFDIGRMALITRMGVPQILRDKKWGIAVAGSSVRYRKRMTVFERLKMRSRIAYWDARFVYVEHSLWNARGECSLHALLRCAVTQKGSLVPAPVAFAALGAPSAPPCPDWIRAWIEADTSRPWPPMQD